MIARNLLLQVLILVGYQAANVACAETNRPMHLSQAMGIPVQQPAAMPLVTSSEPRWPQRFELGAGERTGFGFVVGQPGRIAVSVQWQGVPLVVRLVKPDGSSVDKQAAGSASIEYTATVDDVKRGVLWGVSLRAAQEQEPVGASSAVVYDRPIKLDVNAIATGSVNIQHPVGDLQRAQAEMNARAQRASASRASMQQRMTPVSDLAMQKQMAWNNGQAARQSRLLDQIKTRIPVEAHQKMLQQIAMRAQGRVMAIETVPVATAGAAPQSPFSGTGTGSPSEWKVGGGTTRSAHFGAGAGSQATSVSRSADTGTGTSGSNSGAQPVGTAPFGSAVADPAIASLSVAEGQPGDPVLIAGSGFLNNPGEVHFIVAANGKDLTAPVTTWNDTQIFASVPDVSGVSEFNGVMYVKRGAQKSKEVSFHFRPAEEFRILNENTFDRNIQTPYRIDLGQICHPACAYGFNLDFLLIGHKEYDEYYRNTFLRNGWIVDSAYLAHLSFSANGTATDLPGPSRTDQADAYISELRPGTNSPFVKVRWWYDAGGNSAGYVLRVVIKGPRGVPYQ
jgi:hypothetical protein